MGTAADALGGFHELPATARGIADAVFIGVLVLAAVLERLQYRLGEDEPRHWWASNGRDVVNAFTFATLGLGLKLIGFGGPVAVLLAGAMVVLLTAAQAAFQRTRWATAYSAACSIALGLPILLIPARLDAWMRDLVVRLYP